MSYLPKSVEEVIRQFEKLPGIGSKSAARMTYHFLRAPSDDALKLAEALTSMKNAVKECKSCFNVCEEVECSICANPMRDHKVICIVEEPLDVVAFEKSAIFNGLYFVLGGVISPADGIDAEELRFGKLKNRIDELLKNNEPDHNENSMGIEVVVATNPSLEGEATSAYIHDMFSSYIKSGKIKITRLAMGLPTGADLEYADRLTLKRALEGRRSI